MAKVKPPVGLPVGALPRGNLVSVHPVACDKYTWEPPAAAKPHSNFSAKCEKALSRSSILFHPRSRRHIVVIQSMAGVQEEEFDEGEVWDVLQDYHAGTEVVAPRIAIASPPRNRSGKKAVSSEGARSSKARPSSAPVTIPTDSSSRRRGYELQEDEDASEMLPPHEWLARKMERMGGGRRKARELRKVRDAVLAKTAFSEQ